MEDFTHVKSEALIELQTELKSLSNNLNNLYEVLSDAISAAGEDWQDEKYEDFVNEFRSSKEMVLELSEKYKKWADVWLPPRIEKAIEYWKRKPGIK